MNNVFPNMEEKRCKILLLSCIDYIRDTLDTYNAIKILIKIGLTNEEIIEAYFEKEDVEKVSKDLEDATNKMIKMFEKELEKKKKTTYML